MSNPLISRPKRTAITRLMIRLALVSVSLAPMPSWAQTQKPLSTVTYGPVTDHKLRVDFLLPPGQHYAVTSVDVSAGGIPISKDKIGFTTVDKVGNYRCAVLLLVDKTIGAGNSAEAQKKLLKVVKKTLTNFARVGAAPPYQLEIATISAAGNLEVLADMNSKEPVISKAIETLDIEGGGGSPVLYFETKHAVESLNAVTADRKFVILFSNGVSNDKETSPSDVIKAAHDSDVHICTVAFPGPSGVTNGIRKLQEVAEQTGGYWISAEGAGLLPDSEVDLLKFTVSGAMAQVDLTGLNSPANLQFTVKAEYDRTYTFAHVVENLPPVAAPTTAKAASVQPSPSHSVFKLTKAWLFGHPIMATVAAIALIGLIAFIVGLFRMVTKKPAAVTPISPDMAETPETHPNFQEEEYPSAWLETLDSEQTRYPLSKSAIRIGRKPDNDIVMKNDSVSGHHAEIIRRGQEFIIADLDSSNSVFVRGKRIEKVALQDGDIVELGEVRLRFIEQNSI
jgi:hypothetical protein